MGKENQLGWSDRPRINKYAVPNVNQDVKTGVNRNKEATVKVVGKTGRGGGSQGKRPRWKNETAAAGFNVRRGKLSAWNFSCPAAFAVPVTLRCPLWRELERGRDCGVCSEHQPQDAITSCQDE